MPESETGHTRKSQQNQLLELHHQLKLFGQGKGSKLLRDNVQRVLLQGRSEVVAVHGESGMGKTLLVESLHDTVSDMDGFFATGNSTSQMTHRTLLICQHILHSEWLPQIR
jgi:ABC-type phosphonate transport system ATPase subunit